MGGRDSRGQPRFQRVKAPGRAEQEHLVHTLSERIGRYLELEPQDDTGPAEVLSSSIIYRVCGPHQGRKAFSLQAQLSAGSLEEATARVAKVADFSLHAGVAAARHKWRRLERLSRY